MTAQTTDMEMMTILLIAVGLLTAVSLAATVVSSMRIRQLEHTIQDALKDIGRAREKKVQRAAPLSDRHETNSQPPIARPQPRRTLADRLTHAAYDTYWRRYQQLVSELNVDNYQEKSTEMADLVVEMGIWAKDYLPVAMGDVNATEAQRCNAKSVETDVYDNVQAFEPKTANGSPYDTPLEAMGLIARFKEMGIRNLELNISGYRYE